MPQEGLERYVNDASNIAAAKKILKNQGNKNPTSEDIGMFLTEEFKKNKSSNIGAVIGRGLKKMKKALGKKDGGRVPYQMGGEVMEEMSSVTEMGMPAPTAPAKTQDLTYDELRTRLPREITDDVVALIATSKQALLDFAEIQTQQDIDNFNQLYNVNLVLPQEG